MNIVEIVGLMRPLMASGAKVHSKEYFDMKVQQVKLAAEYGHKGYVHSQCRQVLGRAWVGENHAVKVAAMNLFFALNKVHQTIDPKRAGEMLENFNATVMRHGVGAPNANDDGPAVDLQWLNSMEDREFNRA